MNRDPSESIHQGYTASSGCIVGRIAICLPRPHPADQGGTPSRERRRLLDAVKTASSQLRLLKSGVDRLAAQILEFQIELLEDRHLIDPVLDRLDRGQSGPDAWRAELDAQISDYQTADDELFRSRANDFIDVRDRVLSILLSNQECSAKCEPGAIYVSENLTPSRFLEIDWTCFDGIALARGSAACHVALLARARRVPMIYGLGDAITQLHHGAEAVLDADAGRLIQFPGPKTFEKYSQVMEKKREEAKAMPNYLTKQAVTSSGEHIHMGINVDNIEELKDVDPSHCDGIGLVRTEIMFAATDHLPDEEEQYRLYKKLLEWAKGRPVIIRTLDAGGDKPIAGLTHEGETNPFMGLRGVRLSLAHPDVFRVQLRALARAAEHGMLKILLPMITEPSELNRVRNLLTQEVQALEGRGIAARTPPLGIMVEVPAAALRVHAFQADFFSIGSNDLIQYATAACRDCMEVAGLQDPLNPAVLELIRRVVVYGAAAGKEVSLCGDMAAMPQYIPTVLDAGLRSLSVPPAVLGPIKKAVAQYGARHG